MPQQDSVTTPSSTCFSWSICPTLRNIFPCRRLRRMGRHLCWVRCTRQWCE